MNIRIRNVYSALSRLDPQATAWTFWRGSASPDTDGSYHIQGIAWLDGYYYLSRSRPNATDDQKLLVVSRDHAFVEFTYPLTNRYNHAGGVQIYSHHLVVPLEDDDVGHARVQIYDVEDPAAPRLVQEISLIKDGSLAAGITVYGDSNYLVASYGPRDTIYFYILDENFQHVYTLDGAPRAFVWKESEQDREGWYPDGLWRDGSYEYETINLITDEAGNLYVVMFYREGTLDLYSLQIDVDSGRVDVKKRYSLVMRPMTEDSFRYAAGLTIQDADALKVYSGFKSLDECATDNPISEFASLPGWPWRLVYKFDTGGEVKVAMNNLGQCVEVHCGSPGGAHEYDHYYRVGTVDPETKTVSWGDSHYYDTGGTLAIAVDDAGNCVEVHCGRAGGGSEERHYYRVGKADFTTQTIAWGSSHDYDSGGELAIALDNNGTCVDVHMGRKGGTKQNQHFYRVGTVEFTTKEIQWGVSTNYGDGGGLAIAVDNHGHCVEVHRGTPGTADEDKHYYRLGVVEPAKRTIIWGEQRKEYDTGGGLAVALDDSGRCVEVHRGSEGGSNKNNHYYKQGQVRFDQDEISWTDGGLYDTGGSVAIAMNKDGIGVEVHRGRPGGSNEHNLYCRLFEGP